MNTSNTIKRKIVSLFPPRIIPAYNNAYRPPSPPRGILTVINARKRKSQRIGNTMHEVPLDEAQAKFKELIGEALQGQAVGIRVDEQLVLLLVPTTQAAPKRIPPNIQEFEREVLPEQADHPKRFFTMSEDFDAPLADFEEYMQ
jgi:antitoxin (DNA-binding transcriptional repressor) of toxin-antitoxin stability system